MRAIDIRITSAEAGFLRMKTVFKKNWKHYLQEAFGLAIFMMSACLFGGLLESNRGLLHNLIPGPLTRSIITGALMGATALFIFYSPLTSPSGSHINPAVTISFLRLGKMCHWDALFYILFQFAGGTVAVYIMAILMRDVLTAPPVNFVVTVPGKSGSLAAAITELIIAFITMTIVLFTSENEKLKKFSRIITACLVCCYVIFAGPISGFGMNPARSFASALPAKIWTGFWIYAFVPFLGMLSATEVFLLRKRKKYITIKYTLNQQKK